MALASFGHIIEELEGYERRPAEDGIPRRVRTMFLSAPSALGRPSDRLTPRPRGRARLDNGHFGPAIASVDLERKPASECPVRRASGVAGSARSVARIDASECRRACQESRSVVSATPAAALGVVERPVEFRSCTFPPSVCRRRARRARCSGSGASTRRAGGAAPAGAGRCRPLPLSSAPSTCRPARSSPRRRPRRDAESRSPSLRRPGRDEAIDRVRRRARARADLAAGGESSRRSSVRPAIS